MKVKPIGKRRVAAKAKKTAGKVKAARIAETGLTTRIYGHLSARGRRTQGWRDAKQAAAGADSK